MATTPTTEITALSSDPHTVQAVYKVAPTILQALHASSAELASKARVSEAACSRLQRDAASAIYPIESRRVALDDRTAWPQRLSLGDPSLDSILRGGLPAGMVTELSGESSAGKTQICLQLCLTAQLPHTEGGLASPAVYISTEGAFSSRRLGQLMPHFVKVHPEARNIDLLNNIFVEHAPSLEDLWHILNDRLPMLLAGTNARLIIIDSIAALFRVEFDQKSLRERTDVMFVFASKLKRLASQFDAVVLCVNQVATRLKKDSSSQMIPSLGLAWSNCVSTRLMARRITSRSVDVAPERIRRSLRVVFSPFCPSDSCDYCVEESGVHAYPDP